MPDRPVRLLQLGARLVDGALLRLASRLIVGGDRDLASVTSVPSVAGRAGSFCSRGSILCANVFMSTSSVGEAAHFGRRESAFFGRRTSVFMSALSIGDAACFGIVSAFFGRASVYMSALSIGDAACFGRVSAFFGRASVLPALGRAFVLGLRALPAFVGLAATKDLVHDAAHFGRRVSAFFGCTSVFMSALSIGAAACFGRVSAFFGRSSFLPALGRAFVLVLGARPVAFVGPVAVEVLRIAVGRIAAARPSVDQRLVLPQVAKAAARPSVDQRLVGVCVASALLWLELVLSCGRVAVALLWLTVRLPCG